MNDSEFLQGEISAEELLQQAEDNSDKVDEDEQDPESEDRTEQFSVEGLISAVENEILEGMQVIERSKNRQPEGLSLEETGELLSNLESARAILDEGRSRLL